MPTVGLDFQELSHALALHPRATAEFIDAADAAATAMEQLVDWLREHTEAAPTDAPVLERWEREYLRQRLSTWRRGRTGPLLSRQAKGQELGRSELYVSLRGEKGLCYLDKEGQVIVRGPGQEGEHGSTEQLGDQPVLAGIAAEGQVAGEQHEVGRAEHPARHVLEIALESGLDGGPVPGFLASSVQVAQV